MYCFILVGVIHFCDAQDLELKEDAEPQQTSPSPPPDCEAVQTPEPDPRPEPEPEPEPHPETQQENSQAEPVTQQPQKTEKDNQSTQADKAQSKVCLLIKHPKPWTISLIFYWLLPFYVLIIT